MVLCRESKNEAVHGLKKKTVEFFSFLMIFFLSLSLSLSLVKNFELGCLMEPWWDALTTNMLIVYIL